MGGSLSAESSPEHDVAVLSSVNAYSLMDEAFVAKAAKQWIQHLSAPKEVKEESIPPPHMLQHLMKEMAGEEGNSVLPMGMDDPRSFCDGVVDTTFGKFSRNVYEQIHSFTATSSSAFRHALSARLRLIQRCHEAMLREQHEPQDRVVNKYQSGPMENAAKDTNELASRMRAHVLLSLLKASAKENPEMRDATIAMVHVESMQILDQRAMSFFQNNEDGQDTTLDGIASYLADVVREDKEHALSPLSTLIELAIARGSLGGLLEAMELLKEVDGALPLTCSGAMARMARFAPRPVLSLPGEQSVKELSIGLLPVWSRVPSLACDGSYIYVHGEFGLLKVGTGLNGTVIGRVVANRSDFFPSKSGSLAYGAGTLFFCSSAVHPFALHKLSCETLETLQEVDATPNLPAEPASILMSDGYYLFLLLQNEKQQLVRLYAANTLRSIRTIVIPTTLPSFSSNVYAYTNGSELCVMHENNAWLISLEDGQVIDQKKGDECGAKMIGTKSPATAVCYDRVHNCLWSCATDKPVVRCYQNAGFVPVVVPHYSIPMEGEMAAAHVYDLMEKELDRLAQSYVLHDIRANEWLPAKNVPSFVRADIACVWRPFAVQLNRQAMNRLTKLLEDASTSQDEARVLTLLRLVHVNVEHAIQAKVDVRIFAVSGESDGLGPLRRLVVHLLSFGKDTVISSAIRSEAAALLASGLSILFPDVQSQAQLLLDLLESRKEESNATSSHADAVVRRFCDRSFVSQLVQAWKETLQEESQETSLASPDIYAPSRDTVLRAALQAENVNVPRFLSCLLGIVEQDTAKQQQSTSVASHSGYLDLLQLIQEYALHAIALQGTLAPAGVALIPYMTRVMHSATEVLEWALEERKGEEAPLGRDMDAVLHTSTLGCVLPSFASSMFFLCNRDWARPLLPVLFEILPVLDRLNQTLPEVAAAQERLSQGKGSESIVVTKTSMAESAHPYPSEKGVENSVLRFSGATRLLVEFDPRCSTRNKRDWVEIFDAPPDDGGHMVGKRWTGGSHKWPKEPLVVSGEELYIVFTREGAEEEPSSATTDWGWHITITAEFAEARAGLPWTMDVEELLSTLATGFALSMVQGPTAKDDQDERSIWLDSPLLSGGVERSGRDSLLRMAREGVGAANRVMRMMSKESKAESKDVEEENARKTLSEEERSFLESLVPSRQKQPSSMALQFVQKLCSVVRAAPTDMLGGQVADGARMAVLAALLRHCGLASAALSYATTNMEEPPPEDLVHAWHIATEARALIVLRRQVSMRGPSAADLLAQFSPSRSSTPPSKSRRRVPPTYQALSQSWTDKAVFLLSISPAIVDLYVKEQENHGEEEEARPEEDEAGEVKTQEDDTAHRAQTRWKRMQLMLRGVGKFLHPEKKISFAEHARALAISRGIVRFVSSDITIEEVRDVVSTRMQRARLRAEGFAAAGQLIQVVQSPMARSEMVCAIAKYLRGHDEPYDPLLGLGGCGPVLDKRVRRSFWKLLQSLVQLIEPLGERLNGWLSLQLHVLSAWNVQFASHDVERIVQSKMLPVLHKELRALRKEHRARWESGEEMDTGQWQPGMMGMLDNLALRKPVPAPPEAQAHAMHPRDLVGWTVVRGPAWRWGDQDGSGPGKVVRHDTEKMGWVYARWASGTTNVYRWGAEGGSFDLRLVEKQQGDDYEALCQAIPAESLKGWRVMRGLTWQWGDQDGGIGSMGTVVSIAQLAGWVDVRWDAGGSNRYRWGGESSYDVRPVSMDPIAARKISPKELVGWTVQRGEDWSEQYGAQGGDGPGIVVSGSLGDRRVAVVWHNGGRGIYRWGTTELGRRRWDLLLTLWPGENSKAFVRQAQSQFKEKDMRKERESMLRLQETVWSSFRRLLSHCMHGLHEKGDVNKSLVQRQLKEPLDTLFAYLLEDLEQEAQWLEQGVVPPLAPEEPHDAVITQVRETKVLSPPTADVRMLMEVTGQPRERLEAALVALDGNIERVAEMCLDGVPLPEAELPKRMEIVPPKGSSPPPPRKRRVDDAYARKLLALLQLMSGSPTTHAVGMNQPEWMRLLLRLLAWGTSAVRLLAMRVLRSHIISMTQANADMQLKQAVKGMEWSFDKDTPEWLKVVIHAQETVQGVLPWLFRIIACECDDAPDLLMFRSEAIALIRLLSQEESWKMRIEHHTVRALKDIPHLIKEWKETPEQYDQLNFAVAALACCGGVVPTVALGGQVRLRQGVGEAVSGGSGTVIGHAPKGDHMLLVSIKDEDDEVSEIATKPVQPAALSEQEQTTDPGPGTTPDDRRPQAAQEPTARSVQAFAAAALEPLDSVAPWLPDRDSKVAAALQSTCSALLNSLEEDPPTRQGVEMMHRLRKAALLALCVGAGHGHITDASLLEPLMSLAATIMPAQQAMGLEEMEKACHQLHILLPENQAAYPATQVDLDLTSSTMVEEQTNLVDLLLEPRPFLGTSGSWRSLPCEDIVGWAVVRAPGHHADVPHEAGVVDQVADATHVWVKWEVSGTRTKERWDPAQDVHGVVLITRHARPGAIPPEMFHTIKPEQLEGWTVERGPDWKWEDQDGGVGHQGTVIGLDSADNPGWVSIRWATGVQNVYRWGVMDGGRHVYDLTPVNGPAIGGTVAPRTLLDVMAAETVQTFASLDDCNGSLTWVAPEGQADGTMGRPPAGRGLLWRREAQQQELWPIAGEESLTSAMILNRNVSSAASDLRKCIYIYLARRCAILLFGQGGFVSECGAHAERVARIFTQNVVHLVSRDPTPFADGVRVDELATLRDGLTNLLSAASQGDKCLSVAVVDAAVEQLHRLSLGSFVDQGQTSWSDESPHPLAVGDKKGAEYSTLPPRKYQKAEYLLVQADPRTWLGEESEKSTQHPHLEFTSEDGMTVYRSSPALLRPFVFKGRSLRLRALGPKQKSGTGRPWGWQWKVHVCDSPSLEHAALSAGNVDVACWIMWALLDVHPDSVLSRAPLVIPALSKAAALMGGPARLALLRLLTRILETVALQDVPTTELDLSSLLWVRPALLARMQQEAPGVASLLVQGLVDVMMAIRQICHISGRQDDPTLPDVVRKQLDTMKQTKKPAISSSTVSARIAGQHHPELHGGFSVGRFLSNMFAPTPPTMEAMDDRRDGPPVCAMTAVSGNIDIMYNAFSPVGRGFPTVRGNVMVRNKGAWYYEVMLHGTGIMQIGWCTPQFQCNAGSGDGVGDDAYSWGYDGERRQLWHSTKSEPYGSSSGVWRTGEVVGCLLDLNKNVMMFTRNGRPMGTPVSVPVRTEFFPAISFGSGAMAEVNFSQSALVYLPKNALPLDVLDVAAVYEHHVDWFREMALVDRMLRNLCGSQRTTALPTGLYLKYAEDAMWMAAGRVQMVELDVVECDKEARTMARRSEHVLRPGGQAYEAKSSGNVHFVVSKSEDTLLSVHSVLVTAPRASLASTGRPAKDGLVFVFQERPTPSVLAVCCGWTPEEFWALSTRRSALSAAGGPAVWKEGEPCATFRCTLSFPTGVATVVPGAFHRGKYVVVKLVDELSNVDETSTSSSLFDTGQSMSQGLAVERIEVHAQMMPVVDMDGWSALHPGSWDNGTWTQEMDQELIEKTRPLVEPATSPEPLASVKISVAHKFLSEAGLSAGLQDLPGESVITRWLLLLQTNALFTKTLALANLSSSSNWWSFGGRMSEARHIMYSRSKTKVLESLMRSSEDPLSRTQPAILNLSRMQAAAVEARRVQRVDTTPRRGWGRGTLFHQAYRSLRTWNVMRLRRSGRVWRIRFEGEGADDYGGPYRDSLTELCDDAMSDRLPLFRLCPNGRTRMGVNREKWLPRPGATSPVLVSMLEMLGRLMGIALRTGEPLPLDLPSLVWKGIVGETTDRSDLTAIDLTTARMLKDIEEGEEEAALQEVLRQHAVTSWTVLRSDDEVVELVPGGATKPVTWENHLEFVAKLEHARLEESTLQIAAIRKGLGSVVPLQPLHVFTWRELEERVCGAADFDVEQLRERTTYEGIMPTEDCVRYFWQALSSFLPSERALFLRFVWGRARLPHKISDWRLKLHSFHLRGQPGIDVDDYLPIAHTCFFTLELPSYSSYDVTRAKLLWAISNTIAIDMDFNTGDFVVPGEGARDGEEEELDDL